MRILVVLISSKLGDFIIETFAWRALRKQFPQAHITLLTSAPAALVNSVAYFDAVLPLPPARTARLIRAAVQLPYLALQRYDLVLSFSVCPKVRFFTRLIPAKRTELVRAQAGKHITALYTDVLQRIGCRKVDTSYELPLAPGIRQQADAWLTRLKQKPFIVINPFATTAEYTLTQLRTRQLVAALRKRYGTSYAFVGLDYQGRYQWPEDVSVCTATDVLQVAAIIKRAAYVISPDTGITHVADTFHVPMTVLFAPTPKKGVIAPIDINAFVPRDAKHILVGTPSVNDLDVQAIARSVELSPR